MLAASRLAASALVVVEVCTIRIGPGAVVSFEGLTRHEPLAQGSPLSFQMCDVLECGAWLGKKGLAELVVKVVALFGSGLVGVVHFIFPGLLAKIPPPMSERNFLMLSRKVPLARIVAISSADHDSGFAGSG